MTPKAYPDTTGYAPADEQWHAVDDDTYDGAAPRALMGHGRTANDAIADLLDQIRAREPLADRIDRIANAPVHSLMTPERRTELLEIADAVRLLEQIKDRAP
jgi:hypothetical protein